VYTRRIPDIDPLQDDASLVDVIRRESELSQQPNPGGVSASDWPTAQGLVYRWVAGDDLSELFRPMMRSCEWDSQIAPRRGRPLEEFDAVLQPEQHTHLNETAGARIGRFHRAVPC